LPCLREPLDDWSSCHGPCVSGDSEEPRKPATVLGDFYGRRAGPGQPAGGIVVERVTLNLGDRPPLFTDGVTEARPVGVPRVRARGLLALLEGVDPSGDAHTTGGAVLAVVDTQAAGAALDDTALLVIRATRRCGS